MKKIMLILTLIAAVLFASAQSKVRLNGYGAYVFDDGFDVYNDANNYFNGKVKGGFQYGGSIEYLPHANYSVELSYIGQSTNAPTTFKAGLTNPARNENFDVGLNYILLGGNRLQQTSSGKVEGYGGFMGGVLITSIKSPSTGRSGSNTSFAWGAKAGANFWSSSRVGIKLQAQLLSAVRATGGDVYFSYWGPVVLQTYTALWQFSLGGGITIKMGN